MDADAPNVGYLLSDTDRARINSIVADLDFDLAATLDKAVNGTSLMLMLKLLDSGCYFQGMPNGELGRPLSKVHSGNSF